MGTVYRAEHVLMKRVVALKIIQGEFRNNLLLQRRFEREVQAIARLSHPNIVTAYDAREDSGWLYLVTELIEGTDLGKLVKKKGPLSAAEQEQEFRRRRQEDEKAGKKSDQEQQAKSAKSEHCMRAQEYLVTLKSGQRISRTATSGERYYMDENQVAQELAKTEQTIKQVCTN